MRINKKIVALVLLVAIAMTIIFWDTIYLKTNQSEWNEISRYINFINEERERVGKAEIAEYKVDAETKYIGNYIYTTKIYVDGQFEMIFLTKASKESPFQWEYHTVPFTTADFIVDEALEDWAKNK